MLRQKVVSELCDFIIFFIGPKKMEVLQLLMFILIVYMIAIVYVFSFKAEPFNYMEGTPEYIASDDEL